MFILKNALSRPLSRLALPLMALLSLLPRAVEANDTMAAVGSGGLILATTEDVSMDREDLYISPSEVRVDYVFTNRTSKAVESIVAFPMPAIRNTLTEYIQVPNPESDNFMDFKVEQDGAPIEVELQQRAQAGGLDVTEEIKAQGVPLTVTNDKTRAAIDALPEETLADWMSRGILQQDPEPDANGKPVYVPAWSQQSTYWWRTVFPAGRAVKVHHSYKPIVGGTTGTVFLMDGKKTESFPVYARRYCLNDTFFNLVLKTEQSLGKDNFFMEKWLSYILLTGNNWQGPIGTFHLTIDKKDPAWLVSFCGNGVKKTGPTTFEMTQKDYVPQRDLEVLIVHPYARQ